MACSVFINSTDNIQCVTNQEVVLLVARCHRCSVESCQCQGRGCEMQANKGNKGDDRSGEMGGGYIQSIHDFVVYALFIWQNHFWWWMLNKSLSNHCCHDCWCIVDASLIHRWITVDSSLMYCWPILDSLLIYEDLLSIDVTFIALYEIV